MKRAFAAVVSRLSKLTLGLVGLGSVIVGAGSCGSSAVPVYGVDVTCERNADCEAQWGPGWVCSPSRSCVAAPDAGASDAGR